MTTSPAGKVTLARNTLYAVLGHVVALAVPLLVTPYIVRRIGLDGFGVWAALSILVLLVSQYDLGLWNAVAREVAARRTRDDLPGLRRLLATCLVYDFFAGACLVAVAAAAGRMILPLLIPGMDAAVLYPVLMTVAVQAVLAPALRHTVQTLYGLQRVDLVNVVAVIIAPLSVVGLVAFLESGAGLWGLAMNGLVFQVLQLGILLVALKRLGFPVSVWPGHYSRSEHAALLSFGGKVEIGRLLLLLFRCDRLVLSACGFALSRVAFYQFGASLADRMGASIGVLSTAVLPAASELQARGDTDRIRMLFMRTTKYHALATVLLLGFGVLFAGELLILWMGESMPRAVEILRIMAIGGSLFAVVWPAHALGVGLGRPWLQTTAAAAGLSFALLLYMTLGRRYDVEGLAWAATSGLALVQIVQMIGLRKALYFRWREYVGNAFLKPLTFAAPVGLVFALRTLLAPHLPEVDGRLAALAYLAPAFLAAAGLGWIIARAFRVIDDEDTNLLRSLVSRSSA